MTPTGRLRVMAAVVWTAVVLVALFGTSAGASTLELCGGVPCDHHSAAADGDHDLPSHEACLHDDACGGGGALGHGGGFVGVVAQGEIGPAALLVLGARHPRAHLPNIALLVGEVERPPRSSA